ncbi:hypothetical protein ACFZA2_01725 [Microbacterium sp. NPDC007973]|uniref:hypothetical protein n=1 Tax=Microbacterium sp. NPDC007973 TaxID=3364182 RepID=UPI0036EB78D3
MADSPYPPYIPLRTISWGRDLKLETTAPLRTETKTVASRSLVWQATGEAFFPAGAVRTPTVGEEAVIEVPRTDLTGWVDAQTGDPLDPALGPTHTYVTTVSVFDGERLVDRYDVGPYAVTAGTGAIDGDLMRFNGIAPPAYSAAVPWDLTGGASFPPAAKNGDIGIDWQPVLKPDGSVVIRVYRNEV